MSGYYERYLHGEHAAVWEELSQLGESIYTEPIHADARAVARETMRRAQAAIVRLQQRLRALGYQFGVTHFEPATCFWMEDELRPPPPFIPALADATEKLAALEAACGPLPLSFRAWHEHIESVSFAGAFTETATVAASHLGAMTQTMAEPVESESVGFLTQEAPTQVPAPLLALAPEVVEFIRAHPDQVDPFWYWPALPPRHELLHHRSPDMVHHVLVCPDAAVKGGEPGGIAYITALTPAMDSWVESERWRLPFVPYLRHSLLDWGGFPGIGEYTNLAASIMAPLVAGLQAF